MRKITENPEQHLSDYINGSTVKAANNMVIMRFALSRLLDQESLINHPDHITETLETHRHRAEKVFDGVCKKLETIKNGYMYLCQDNDIFIIARLESPECATLLKESYQSVAKCLHTGISETCKLDAGNLERYKKIVEERVMHVQLMQAYKMMANPNLAEKMKKLRQGRRRPLVLVADHEIQNACFICKLIENDFDVIKVKSGPEAIIEYMNKAPDCVVLDIAPPGMSGLDVSVCIKAIDIMAYIVMMSVDAIEEKIIDAFNSGAGDFLKKPFNQNRFVKAINKSPYIQGDSRALEELEESEEVFLF